MYDAQIIGSGPNGLAAAIMLAQHGLHVKVYEMADSTGGGTRTFQLTQPGYLHDICSAIHPLAYTSPYIKELPLSDFGLTWIKPEIPLVHPLDDGQAVALYESLAQTMNQFNNDQGSYKKLIAPLVDNWPALSKAVLGPLNVSESPLLQARFGLQALKPALSLALSQFKSIEAQALFGGLAAHSILPLDYWGTSAIGLILAASAHLSGWPFPKGGSQNITDAMAAYFSSLGGEIETGYWVESLEQLPPSKTYFFDTSPRAMSHICGKHLSTIYRRRIARFKPGHGVFKIDAALSEPIPWQNEHCRKAGTLHLGGTLEEIAASEACLAENRHSEKPYTLIAQQSLFDDSRAPGTHHTLWAYCHVPNGSTRNMTRAIFAQIERFAPGFRDCLLDIHTTHTADFEAYNPNYIGGDINGGLPDITQLFTRPIAKSNPYATSADGIYLCSSSTPPGGGVHGMCGYHAAKSALKNDFKLLK